MPMDLDVQLRAYKPAFELIGRPMPDRVTVTNINDARKATGLTWEPATEAQYRARRVGGTDLEPMREYAEVPEYLYVTRGEGGPILGPAHATYKLFHNAEVFAVAETIGQAALEMGQQVRFVNGGEVAGGKRVFLMADLGVREIPGDPSPHVRYLGMLSSHDGSAALKIIGTDMRWFCTNAIRAAEMRAAASGTAFSFRHTSRIQVRLANSHKAIRAALLQHDAIERVTRELLAVKVSRDVEREWFAQYSLARVILKADPTRASFADVSPQRAFAVDKLDRELQVIYGSRTCNGIRGTAYGLFAAAGEHLDNVRTATSQDARFDRTMVNVERGKALALDVLRRLI